MRSGLLLLLTLVILPITTSITVYEEPIRNGHTYVEACGELNTTCGTYTMNTSISTTCSLYSINVSDCTEVTLHTPTTSEDIKVLNYEKPLETVSTENTPVLVAKRAYAKSVTNKSITEELEWLKANRNEELKCWPQDNCLLSTTTEVMTWLSRANLNRTYRVYDDGLKYIEALQNKFSNEDWEVDIRTDEDTQCTVNLEDNQLFSEVIEDGSQEYDVEYKANEALNISCENDFTVQITDSFGNLKLLDKQDSNDNIYYLFPGGCWPRDTTERICSVKTTAKAIDLSHLEEDVFNDAEDWVEDQIRRGFITGERLDDDEDVIAHARLHAATENDDIRDWLLFHQQNDGSFQNDDTFLATVEVLRSIQEDSEWIDDAEDWVETNRPVEGFDDDGLNGLAYKTLQEEPLRITPSILATDSETVSFQAHGADITFTLQNVTGTIETEGEDPVNGTITFSDVEPGWQQGALIATTSTKQTSVPIVVTEESRVELTVRPTIYTQEPTGFVSGQTSIPENETCILSSTNIFENKTIETSGQFNWKYDIEEGTHNTTATLTCPTPLGNKSVTQPIKLTHYPYPPFTIDLSNTEVEEIETVTVQNNIPKELAVGMEFATTSPFYSIPSTLQIPKDAEANVQLYQLVETSENTTENNTIIAKTLGYTSETDITYSLDADAETVENDVEIQTSSSIPWILILVIIGVGGIGTGIYLTVQNREEPTQKEQEPDADEALKTVVGEIELALDMQEGKTDAQDLREQGYSDDDISDIESMLREILPDKKE